MLSIQRNRSVTQNRIGRVRLTSTVIATLLLCALRLSAQTVPELKILVSGDIPTPITITAKDMASMPRETAEVADPDGGKTTYEGVPLQEILKKAGLSFGRQMRGKELAGYVLASAKDGYEMVFSFGELDPDLGGARILVADKRDGKPLFDYQGPARLVVPADKAGARSVRMLEKLEVVKLRK